MSRSVEALVNADMLRWARDSAGINIADAARKIDISADKLASWEEGKSRPTIKQLFKLSKAYKRPATAFYLSEVPRKTVLEHQRDYRRLPGVATDGQSSDLIFALRRAEYRRRIALDLYEDLDIDMPNVPFFLATNESIEEGADKIRRFLDISDEVQIKRWRRPVDAFNGWRAAVESVGVLVFQAQNVDISEMRAISVRERPLPFILLNSSDATNGRVFSLLHEFAHIVLNNARRTDSTRPAEVQEVEIFCNAVASAVLMPRHLVMKVLENLSREDITPELMQETANTLNVSREAFARRLVTLGYADEQLYQKMRRQYLVEYKKRREERKSNIPIGYHVRVVNTAGYHFSRLVLAGLHSGKITVKDASDFFDASAKHLHNIEEFVERREASARESG